MNVNQPSPFIKKDFASIVTGLLEDVASGRGGRTALTDANDGSVVRTLIEVFAREMAVAYEQLDIVYRNAYLDTAEGASLDKVVALLALSRHRAGHLEGTVTFSRGQPAPEDIHIPAGTLVAGKGVPPCATTEKAVLGKGTQLISVGVLSLDPATEGVQLIKAGAIGSMPRPITGVEQVSNPGDLVPRRREETDDELRDRVRTLMQAANTGTVSALELAVRSLGVKQVQVLEYPKDPALLPGQIFVVLGDADLDDDLLAQVADRIEDVRPAGIVVQSGPATQIWAQVTATLTLNADLPDRQRQAIEDKLTAALSAYFEQLKVGEPVRQAKIRSILIGDDAVVGCDLTPGFPFLLEPFVRADGKLVSKSGKYLRSSGDIEIGPRERVGLLPKELPVRLTLQGPAPAVSLDVVLEIAMGGSDTGVKDGVIAAFGQALTDAVKKAGGGDGLLEYDVLRKLADGVVKPGTVARLRVTAVHEADGRVVELAFAGTTDHFNGREVPRLRNVSVSVQK